MNKTLLIKGLSLLAILLSSCGGASPQTLPATAPATEALALVTEPPSTSTAVPATDPPLTTTAVPATTALTLAGTDTQVSFANDVMPILQAACIKCHGKEQIKAGLDLRTHETAIQGSFKRVVIVPGDAASSFLVQQVVNGKMPKLGQKLTAEQIQIISEWVNTGALNN